MSRWSFFLTKSTVNSWIFMIIFGEIHLFQRRYLVLCLQGMGTIGLFLWNASGTTRYQILCQSYIALQISLQNMSTFQPYIFDWSIADWLIVGPWSKIQGWSLRRSKPILTGKRLKPVKTGLNRSKRGQNLKLRNMCQGLWKNPVRWIYICPSVYGLCIWIAENLLCFKKMKCRPSIVWTSVKMKF